MYLAIDPGKDTGWALFSSEKSLLTCGVGRPPYERGRFTLIERPQIYSAKHMKGDPNDIITLAINVGEHKARSEDVGAVVQMVLPQEWKGQVPKEIHGRRILAACTEQDMRVVTTASAMLPGSKVHNMIDAIGLGQWAFVKGPWR